MNEQTGPLGFTRPAHARMQATGGGNIPVDGALRSISAGQLHYLVTSPQAPAEVRSALAKVRMNEPLCPMEIEACRVYFTQAVNKLH